MVEPTPGRDPVAEAEALFRLVLKELPAIVWSTDRELRFTSSLGAGLSALNLRHDEVVGVSLFEFLQTDDPDFPAISAHTRALQGESVSFDQTFQGCTYQSRVDPLRNRKGEIVGCIGVAQDITERKKSERALREAQEGLERRVADRTAELAQANEQLKLEVRDRVEAEETVRKEQHYLRHLLELQDRDRQLISYEIHDGLVQQLAGATMQFEAFSRLDWSESEEVRKVLDSGMNMLGEGISEARRLINGLRPPILDEFGVVAAIEDLISQMKSQDKPAIEFFQYIHFDRLVRPLENTVFRIVQESLNNACRHSQSGKVRLELARRGGRLWVEVRDWGIGFDQSNIRAGCFGLEGIKERASAFGGHATIDSTPGTGTRIVVELPLILEDQFGEKGCRAVTKAR